jgi:hypothetical protein
MGNFLSENSTKFKGFDVLSGLNLFVFSALKLPFFLCCECGMANTGFLSLLTPVA